LAKVTKIVTFEHWVGERGHLFNGNHRLWSDPHPLAATGFEGFLAPNPDSYSKKRSANVSNFRTRIFATLNLDFYMPKIYFDTDI